VTKLKYKDKICETDDNSEYPVRLFILTVCLDFYPAIWHRERVAFSRYFYQYLTIAHEHPGESRSQGSRERAAAKGWHIQIGRHKKPYRASCRMFLHLEIGSSKPIEVKTKTRGLEKSGKNAESFLAPESTDNARKSIKD